MAEFGVGEAIRSGEAALGVWGVGFIGLSTAVSYAVGGARVVGFDIDAQRVAALRRGQGDFSFLSDWLGLDFAAIGALAGLTVTTDRTEILTPEVRAHFIAVPTELDGEPYVAPVLEAIGDICRKPLTAARPDLVVIESTVTVRDIDRVERRIADAGYAVGREILLGVAPRRDWFGAADKNLRNLPRVYGGADAATVEEMRIVLAMVCEHLERAGDHRVAALSKAVENSLLHLPSVYAMQLAAAYPQLDVREALRLASTHWRIPYYYPTIGTGGYCIPVSSKYVLQGAARPRELELARVAVATDSAQPRAIARLVNETSTGPVAILGVCYKGDLKVHKCSPALAVLAELRAAGRPLRVHDPYYSAEELAALTGAEHLDFPAGLAGCGAVVLVPDHRAYREFPLDDLLPHLNDVRLVVDNFGAWERFDDAFAARGIIYRRVGDGRG